MADRLAEQIPSSGLAPTYHLASAGGDRVPGGAILHVQNGSGSSINLTLVTDATVDTDLAVADRVVAVASGTPKHVRVPDIAAYTDIDGMVAITWSATGATITFAVLE